MTNFQKVEATKLAQLDTLKTNIKSYLRGGFYHFYKLPLEARTLEGGFQFLADKEAFKGEKNIYGVEFAIKEEDLDTTVFVYTPNQDLSGGGLFVVSSSPIHRGGGEWLVSSYPRQREGGQ